MILQTGAQVADKAVVQGILSRVDQLAEKLGTTAANVWSIYLTQARVEAIRDSAIAAIFLSAAIFLPSVARNIWKKSIEASYSEEIRLQFVSVILYLATILCIILFFANAYDAVGEWVNPQFWAFQHITADIRGLL